MASISRWPRRSATCLALLASSAFVCVASSHAANPDKTVDQIPTASPIKHVIIIVGENRSFDHLFATYVPQHQHERVLNLFSQGIVNADGSPGPHFAKGQQYKIIAPPNGAGSFFMSAGSSAKSLYTFLPVPDVAGVQNPPDAFILSVPGGDPGLPAADQFLFGTGGTGLPYTKGPDTRITHVTSLPPGPFQMTGPTMPYDAYTADTIHQYFQMVQQMDCAIDNEHVSKGNPTGCLHDLQSAITTTYSTSPLTSPPQVATDTGQTMAFFNMQQGDVPLLKALADKYTMSDNYHQPVMGGTGPDSVPLGFADQVFFTDSSGNAATPPASQIYNPNPQIAAYTSGNFNLYTLRKQWFNCSDPAAPGVKPILDYLQKLPYEVDPKCQAGAFYNAVNVNPAWTPSGAPQAGTVVPMQTIRSIGDVLAARNIPWKYYGGGYNLSVAGNPINGYCNICNPFEFQANYPAMRADHMRDVTDLFTDIKNGTLPAVSYVKPDGALDGHPASSKFNLFEDFAGNIIDLVKANPEVWKDTAIFVTVDEGGGYYDSGFIQWVDFFGTGPRIPMIAVSPFSVGGHVSHVYNEHSSFVKFVERNWKLATTLTARSRDNLPNPVQSNDGDADDYVPRNMPAIGDLFDMFNFGRDDNDDQGDE